jgi:RNA polymerase sigma factor (TIGR02999 family)
MEQMFVLVYNELHQLAARKLRSERDSHTLSTTALVHEAWLELNKLNRIQWQNRGHFLAVAAQAMRRILIDYAVARRREKRGGGQVLLSLDDGDALAIASERADELVSLDEALARLQG